MKNEVCRSSMGVPPIDIERAMKETKLIDEKGNYYLPLHFPIDNQYLDDEEKRLYVTLKFKLAMKITKDRNNLHFPDPRHIKFLNEFHEIATAGTKSRQELKEQLAVNCVMFF